MFGHTILICVPHPDDEVVAAASCIAAARSSGSRVLAFYLTHGCPARDALWPWERPRYPRRVARRQNEARAVAAMLGLDCVGFSSRPARCLWRDMDTVYAEIKDAVQRYKVDQLWVPAYEGGNADHDALNAIARRWMDETGGSVVEFAEYNFAGGKAHSQTFPMPNGTEIIHPLSDAEKAAKAQALRAYESEQGNLSYVRVDQESYRPLARYDYAAPPHDGVLWYARFHWVPFAHPRIDFSKPSDVRAAMARFLTAATTSALPETAMPASPAHTRSNPDNAG